MIQIKTFQSSMKYDMEWISVKAELPPEDAFVNMRHYVFILEKVKLKACKDPYCARGYYYEWQYPSGITAANFDKEDEWMFWEEKM